MENDILIMTMIEKLTIRLQIEKKPANLLAF